jgi:hypothetical protein
MIPVPASARIDQGLRVAAAFHGGCFVKAGRALWLRQGLLAGGMGPSLDVAGVRGPQVSPSGPPVSFYPGVSAGVWRQSLSKLWVAVISRHSARHAPRPLRWKRSMPRLCLVLPKIGSIITERCR